MVDCLTAAIMEAIDEAKKEKPTREISLVITKLEEALMWRSAAQRVG
jgi:hypothetical protein